VAVTAVSSFAYFHSRIFKVTSKSEALVVAFSVFLVFFVKYVTYCCCAYNAGIYPHLVVATDGVTINSPNFELLVKFGSVPVGQNAEKWIEIINLSPVRKSTKKKLEISLQM